MQKIDLIHQGKQLAFKRTLDQIRNFKEVITKMPFRILPNSNHNITSKKKTPTEKKFKDTFFLESQFLLILKSL